MNLESQLKDTQNTLILQNNIHTKGPANNNAEVEDKLKIKSLELITKSLETAIQNLCLEVKNLQSKGESTRELNFTCEKCDDTVKT